MKKSIYKNNIFLNLNKYLQQKMSKFSFSVKYELINIKILIFMLFKNN